MWSLISPLLQWEIFFTTAWSIWNARNDSIWEEKTPVVDEICQGAAVLALDFLETGASDYDRVNMCTDTSRFKWRPPTMDCFKLNMTCRCVPRSELVGVGILIRNSMGLAVMQTKIWGCGNMLQVQASVVAIALKFAFDIGLHNLEVGCQELQSLILKGSPCCLCCAPCGVLVDDICWGIPFFNVLSFSSIPKLCNKAALVLATKATCQKLLMLNFK